jgi:hypothetical protein
MVPSAVGKLLSYETTRIARIDEGPIVLRVISAKRPEPC